MDAPGRLVDIGGRRLHYVAEGRGAPVVVLESGGGGGSSVQDWPVMRLVSGFTRCIAYDRAGLGWSDPAPGPRTWRRMAEDLDALLTAAGDAPPYVLVGGSFGGLIVRAYAGRFPAKVAGMVLVDTADEEKYFATMRVMLPQHEAELRAAADRAERGELVAEAEPHAAGLDAAAWAAAVHVLGSRRHFEASLEELRAIDHATPDERRTGGLGGLGDRPLVVLSHGRPYGEDMALWEDGWADAQRRLAALSTNSIHVTAAENGHAIAVENPKLVAAAVAAVVRTVRGGPFEAGEIERLAAAASP